MSRLLNHGWLEAHRLSHDSQVFSSTPPPRPRRASGPCAPAHRSLSFAIWKWGHNL